MNKANIADAVFEKIGGTKKAAEDAVETVFDFITNSLKKGEDISVAGFGVFVVKQRAAREARNPRTGETVHVPATTVPKFRAGKSLKDAVK
ncbi:MAG: HU family DNA-binding protein [Patescibacteria group bacterium]